MKILRDCIIALSLFTFGACVADEPGTAPAEDSDVELSTTEQFSSLEPMTWKPSDPTPWLPKDTLCDNLEGTIILPDASGTCATKITVSNCKWDAGKQQCNCSKTVERVGPGC